MLTIFLEKMSAPREGLDDYRRARLTEAIKAVWSSRGCEMTITDVQEYLYAQKEDRVRDIAVQLFPFTRQGQFGYWFDGRNNLRFQKNFVVLELDDLKQQEVLQKVVLMLLVSRIQYEMYNHTQLERKLAIFDEAKEYLEDPITARFLADGYRRFRKLNGSAWLVTQSLKDVDGSPGMNAIVSNAAFKIILPQEASEVERLADSKLLPLDTYTLRQMKSVQTVPGLYSEIMVMQGSAWGIVRPDPAPLPANPVLHAGTGTNGNLRSAASGCFGGRGHPHLYQRTRLTP
jgi:conjugal transfer ATP-binding protein TraC